MGWSRRWVELWMALRDRRGPLTAIVLAAAYLLLLIEGVLLVLSGFVEVPIRPISVSLELMLGACLVGFLWRSATRFCFTAREYGVMEGLRATLRVPVANVITIIAGRRALFAYFASLRSGRVEWDKTAHDSHPASMPLRRAQV